MDVILYILVVFDLLQVALTVPNFLAVLKEMASPRGEFTDADRLCVREISTRVRDIQEKTDALTHLHSATDETGAPKWFIRPQIYQDIENIKNSVRVLEIYNRMSHNVYGGESCSGEE